MDGITDFDMKFKRSLIEQLTILNKTMKEIKDELRAINDIKIYGDRAN